MQNYITDDVRALIGVESEWTEACDVVERGQIRRHAQATMDGDRAYYDDGYAAETRFGGIIAPPLFPLHAQRVPPDILEPFARAAADPDFDGSIRDMVRGLPPVPLPLTGELNGGSEIEIHRYAKVGDRIRVKSKYLDIYQKNGRSGPLVFILIERVYANQDGDVLLRAVQTRIAR